MAGWALSKLNTEGFTVFLRSLSNLDDPEPDPSDIRTREDVVALGT